MEQQRLTSFAEFWPFYVAQHLHPVNQALHFGGTSLALACVVLAASASAWWLPAALFAGYGPAWVGHFGFENNRPATLRYPLWSLIGDFKMFALMLSGRMRAHVEQARKLYPAGA